MESATVTQTLRAPSAPPPEMAVTARKVAPVTVWAAIGAAILAFEIYVLVRWVTGPYFKTVSVGRSAVPDWMKISVRSVEILMFVAFAFCLYRFLIRPWRKERQLPGNTKFDD